MRHFILSTKIFTLCAIGNVLLSSCTDVPLESTPAENISSTSAITSTPPPKIQEVEKDEILPDYLKHELSGSDLEFVKVLDDNTAYIRYQISYLSDGLKISGIMNIPKWAWPFPLVILNHGHIDTSVYTLGRGLKREQDYLARAGFAVLHTDYRNHAFSDKDMELIEEKTISRSQKYGSDSINAIIAVREASALWVSEVANIDAENVGMLGHSMGGWVTMYALVAHPDLVDAAVLYAPVHSNEYYNFQKWTRPRLSTAEYRSLEEKIWPLSVTGTFLPYSPEWHLSRIKTPIEMYWWTSDESCSIEWGRYMDERFRNAGIDITFNEYAWEGHEFSREWTDFMQWVAAFYGEKLKWKK